MDLLQEINALEKEIRRILTDVQSLEALDQFRINFLGKKGKITLLTKQLGALPREERPDAGKAINRLKSWVEQVLEEKKQSVKALVRRKRIEGERFDITIPGRRIPVGREHPITLISREIADIFMGMGFKVAEGPEVELDYYNFEALNIPKDHPARDMQDTFYVSDNVVLRTHTSPVQVRTMEKQRPPVRVITLGAVYRCDLDVTHTPMFHQVEGLLVDKNISMGDLKGILIQFVHLMFGKDIGVRFRPSFFPFTEPSAEVDIQCVICKGKGCRVCAHTGWLEILGCGMVDPAVYEFVDYDPELYSGFAWGLGVERVAMLKYGIDDLRSFFENDIRFLSHF